MLVISVMVYRNPIEHTVTFGYHMAADQWWARRPVTNFFYFPHFIILYSPFHWLLPPWDEIIWRWFGAAGLGFGLWEFLRATFRENNWQRFTLISLVTLPLMLGAVRNGQANAHLAATLLFAAASLARERWWRAVFFLMLAVALKPLGLAAVGLAFAAFPLLRWRLAVGIILLTASLFCFGPADYVKTQIVGSVNALRGTSKVAEERFQTADQKTSGRKPWFVKGAMARGFADINGLLDVFGCALVGKISTVVRAFAGLVFAVGCWLAARRLDKNLVAPFWAAAAAAWLMLFNPMNETNSYVILAPVIGWWCWYFREQSEWRLAWSLVAMLLSMALLRNVLRPLLGGDGTNAFAAAFFPAMTLLFVGVVVAKTFFQKRAT